MNRIFRRIDKTTFLLYLYLKKFIARKKIAVTDGAVLVLADLLFGDIAMAGYLLLVLHQKYPSRKIVVLSKASLANVVKTFDFVEVVGADYLSWRVLFRLRSASPTGYGEVINIFSWKWFPLLKGFDYGTLSSHPSKKSRDNKVVDCIASMPVMPMSAPDIVMSLLDTPFDLISNSDWKPSFVSARLNLPKPYLVIHVGASVSSRLWPLSMLEKFIKLCASEGFFVVFTGLKQDASYMFELEKMIEKHLQSNFVNLIGKTTILGLLEIISNAKALISVDTGVIHWARFLSVANLSIMGQSDSSLFGGNSSLFDRAYYVSAKKLDCQDKHTFHGIKLNWVSGCARGVCPLETRLCFSSLEEDELELSFYKLISNLS